MSKVFAVNTPNGQVRLTDLPLGVLSRIAKDIGAPSWATLIDAPAQDGDGAVGLYGAACEVTGAEPVTLTPAMLLADPPVFELVDDEMPVAWNGETALPESEGAPVTTGSSGAPGPSDGPLR